MKIVYATILAAALLGVEHARADSSDSFTGAARDAWITGKIETVYALNRHLNPFAIDTDVEDGTVRLTGTVQSDIDRDLAGELAKGIEGVVEVRNELEVGEDDARAPQGSRAAADEGGERAERSFGAWVDDATTTAAVKSKLIANGNTQGLQIDVDTYDDIVTLSGRVESAEESGLAEEIARNTDGVEDVRNELVVERS